MCPSIVIINYSVICLKHCAFFLHAHRHKQHKAAMVKTTRAKAQPQSQKRRTAVAVARQKRRGFKGWKVCENLLRQSMEEIRKGSFQLIHVLACSELLHGVEAEVNWYTGGNSYVTLPTAVAEKRPGAQNTMKKSLFMAALGVVGTWAEERVKDRDSWLWSLYNQPLPWCYDMKGLKRFSATHRSIPPDTDSNRSTRETQ